MREQLRARGLKLTPQRLAVVRELADDPTHPTAQELFDRLRPQQSTMSFATVYNTLDALSAAGLCRARSLAPGSARFDPNVDPHDHLVCDGCGLVRDVPRALSSVSRAPAKSAAAEAPPMLEGFEVHAVEQVFRGLCSACARRAEALMREELGGRSRTGEGGARRPSVRRDKPPV